MSAAAAAFPALREKRHFFAFVLGCLAVAAGVVLHFPMYWMGRGQGFRLAEMPMDAGMYWGMAAILVGSALAAWGLLPAGHLGAKRIDIAVPDHPRLSRAHYVLMVVLTTALVIDVMKPASLGFVLPGLRAEYELDSLAVAWLPFAALCGTVLGSIIWGALADVFGRRASILLSSVLFVGTSICGAMPSFGWNIAMCFIMGAAAGGMLPVTYALLAETMPARHRGWVLVLVGGLGSVGGYIAASLAAAWLEPVFSWRALWFLNLPTGLALVALSALIPESPRFLLRVGRRDEAQATLARFGSQLHEASAGNDAPVLPPPPLPRALMPMTVALSTCGLASGLINFGVLLWLPAHMVSLGHSLAWSSGLLAMSAFMALPTVLAAAWLYGRWSSKRAILAALILSTFGLAGVIHVANDAGPTGWLVSITVLIIGSNAILAMLLPYAAESYPGATRGRAVGWIAACSKAGGPLSQGLTILGMVPALGAAAVVTALTTVGAVALIAVFCVETRDRHIH